MPAKWYIFNQIHKLLTFFFAIAITLKCSIFFMSLMMTVSQMTREGHHGQVGGRAQATLAVNRGLFLGAPRPVEGHRRQWPSWPSIISYPATEPWAHPQKWMVTTQTLSHWTDWTPQSPLPVRYTLPLSYEVSSLVLTTQVATGQCARQAPKCNDPAWAWTGDPKHGTMQPPSPVSPVVIG